MESSEKDDSLISNCYGFLYQETFIAEGEGNFGPVLQNKNLELDKSGDIILEQARNISNALKECNEPYYNILIKDNFDVLVKIFRDLCSKIDSKQIAKICKVDDDVKSNILNNVNIVELANTDERGVLVESNKTDDCIHICKLNEETDLMQQIKKINGNNMALHLSLSEAEETYQQIVQENEVLKQKLSYMQNSYEENKHLQKNFEETKARLVLSYEKNNDLYQTCNIIKEKNINFEKQLKNLTEDIESKINEIKELKIKELELISLTNDLECRNNNVLNQNCTLQEELKAKTYLLMESQQRLEEFSDAVNCMHYEKKKLEKKCKLVGLKYNLMTELHKHCHINNDFIEAAEIEPKEDDTNMLFKDVSLYMELNQESQLAKDSNNPLCGKCPGKHLTEEYNQFISGTYYNGEGYEESTDSINFLENVNSLDLFSQKSFNSDVSRKKLNSKHPDNKYNRISEKCERDFDSSNFNENQCSVEKFSKNKSDKDTLNNQEVDIKRRNLSPLNLSSSSCQIEKVCLMKTGSLCKASSIEKQNNPQEDEEMKPESYSYCNNNNRILFSDRATQICNHSLHSKYSNNACGNDHSISTSSKNNQCILDRIKSNSIEITVQSEVIKTNLFHQQTPQRISTHEIRKCCKSYAAEYTEQKENVDLKQFKSRASQDICPDHPLLHNISGENLQSPLIGEDLINDKKFAGKEGKSIKSTSVHGLSNENAKLLNLDSHKSSDFKKGTRNSLGYLGTVDNSNDTLLIFIRKEIKLLKQFCHYKEAYFHSECCDIEDLILTQRNLVIDLLQRFPVQDELYKTLHQEFSSISGLSSKKSTSDIKLLNRKDFEIENFYFANTKLSIEDSSKEFSSLENNDVSSLIYIRKEMKLLEDFCWYKEDGCDPKRLNLNDLICNQCNLINNFLQHFHGHKEFCETVYRDFYSSDTLRRSEIVTNILFKNDSNFIKYRRTASSEKQLPASIFNPSELASKQCTISNSELTSFTEYTGPSEKQLPANIFNPNESELANTHCAAIRYSGLTKSAPKEQFSNKIKSLAAYKDYNPDILKSNSKLILSKNECLASCTYLWWYSLKQFLFIIFIMVLILSMIALYLFNVSDCKIISQYALQDIKYCAEKILFSRTSLERPEKPPF